MKILQMDVDNITFEPVRPEASIYDDLREKKKTSVDDTLVIFVCVEQGDTKEMGEEAMRDTEEFMKKLDRKSLVIYPFAHLSRNLADVNDARAILDHMFKNAPAGAEVVRAPFGWNKKLILDIKAHPLAEQSRSYGGEVQKPYKKAKPVSFNTSLVRKSNWSGLPDTDHRTIGEKLDLYSFQEVSPSMVYWHPNGYIVFKELIEFMREKESEYGHQEISTPVIANLALWHVSGHIDHYKENMFTFDTDIGNLGLKPMNCPSTILIYKSKKWSYRELPFRTAIFDKLYRKEVSGALTGLFRVQELTQDDGHIFLTENQLETELSGMLKMVREVYETFGLRFIANLSTMPESHMGDEKLWEKATAALKNALEKNGMEYKVKEKEGAYYGPKIDFEVLDALGRQWQCATIQVDYQQPIRFGLEYTGEDGRQQTPVMIHKAILGSLERFIAIMVEHFQGRFPTWIAPVQVKVVSISEQTGTYAEKVYMELKKRKLRVELDVGDRTMEYKLREALTQKIPYIVVVGKKEEDAGSIAVRTRTGKQKFGVKLNEFVDGIEKEISSRSLELIY